MSGLGWLNLQDYVGANQGAADDMAQARENDDVLLDQEGAQAVANGDRLSYGQYLAKRRMRELDSTPVGGNSVDALLVRRGRAQSMGRTGHDWDKAAAARGAAADTDRAYWDKQALRNKGIADADRDARSTQESRYGKAWAAWSDKNTSDMHDNQREITAADEEANSPAQRGSPFVETGYESDESVRNRQAFGRAVGSHYRERQAGAMRNQSNFRRPGGK